MSIKKIKEVFLYGGLGWGLPFFVLFSILQWIEYKPPAFGSLSVFFIVSVTAGCLVGLITKILIKDAVEIKFDMKVFCKSILLFAFVILIYGLIFRYILLPNNWNQSFVGTIILLILLFIASLIQNRMIVKKASL